MKTTATALLLSLLFTLHLTAAPLTNHTARLTNIVTHADGSISTTVKELTFTKSSKFRMGTAPLFVKTGDRMILSETRAASLLPKRPVSKRTKRISPPPAPPGFAPASSSTYTGPPVTTLDPNRRPMHVYRLLDESNRVIWYFTATQKADETLRFDYGDNALDIHYLFAIWDAYPAEQEVGVGMYEESFPKQFYVTAYAVAP